MVIPHSRVVPIRFNLSIFIIFLIFSFAIVGTITVGSLCIDTVEYYRMKKEVSYLSTQFLELKSTISSLKKAEKDFSRIFSVKSKEGVMENIDASNPGSIDIEVIKKEVDEAVKSVTDIRQYLEVQKSVFLSTPRGWPAEGEITSPFGMRDHPITGKKAFHSGVDIMLSVGTPVRATADGIVSFSGWGYKMGYVVVLEHGHGFGTVYAHNSKNMVTVSQTVKRGQVIAISGSTGRITGAHLHYEVWRDRNPLDPLPFMTGGSHVLKKEVSKAY